MNDPKWYDGLSDEQVAERLRNGTAPGWGVHGDWIEVPNGFLERTGFPAKGGVEVTEKTPPINPRAEILATLARELEIQCHYPKGESWKLWVEHTSEGWQARISLTVQDGRTSWTVSRLVPEQAGRAADLPGIAREIVSEMFAKLRASDEPA